MGRESNLRPRDLEQLNDLLDGRLSPEAAVELRLRLEQDPALSDAYRDLCAVGDAFRGALPQGAQLEVPSDFAQRLRERMAAASQAPAGPQRSPWPRRFALAYAAAALLVAGLTVGWLFQQGAGVESDSVRTAESQDAAPRGEGNAAGPAGDAPKSDALADKLAEQRSRLANEPSGGAFKAPGGSIAPGARKAKDEGEADARSNAEEKRARAAAPPKDRGSPASPSPSPAPAASPVSPPAPQPSLAEAPKAGDPSATDAGRPTWGEVLREPQAGSAGRSAREPATYVLLVDAGAEGALDLASLRALLNAGEVPGTQGSSPAPTAGGKAERGSPGAPRSPSAPPLPAPSASPTAPSAPTGLAPPAASAPPSPTPSAPPAEAARLESKATGKAGSGVSPTPSTPSPSEAAGPGIPASLAPELLTVEAYLGRLAQASAAPPQEAFEEAEDQDAAGRDALRRMKQPQPPQADADEEQGARRPAPSLPVGPVPLSIARARLEAHAELLRHLQAGQQAVDIPDQPLRLLWIPANDPLIPLLRPAASEAAPVRVIVMRRSPLGR